MKTYLGIAWAASLVLLTGCNGETVPESYGVYVRDGGALTRLENDMPEAKRRGFSKDAVIIIFDSRLSVAGLGGNPENTFRILPRRYVRFHAVLEHDAATNVPVNIQLSRADEFKAIGDPIACLVAPVKGHTDMIEVKPRQPLRTGLYYADVGGEWKPFAVGIGDQQEKDSAYAIPADGYVDRVAQSAAFSWNNWLSAVGDNGAEEKYSNAERLDKIMGDFKKQFLQNVIERKFLDAVKTVPALSGYYREDYTNLLEKGISSYAESQLADDPQVAVALAARILAFSPDSADGRRIAEQGNETLRAWNDTQASERAAETQKHDEWWRAAHTTNAVVASFPYYPDAWPNEKRARLTLTETTVIDEWQDGWGQRHRADVWLGDVSALEKGSTGRMAAPDQPSAFAVLTIVAKNGPHHAQFATGQDRDQAQAEIAKAIAEFTQKFGISAHKDSTAGTVHRSTEGDSVAYTIDLVRHEWSPPIHVPLNCRSWKWRSAGAASGPIDIKTNDGQIYGNTTPRVDRDSTVTFRSGLADAEKLATRQIVVTFDLD